MFVAFVHVQVKPENVEEFLAITKYNHENSIQESGCIRFDVLQSTDTSNLFFLNEVYESTDAAAAHKETEHYKKWRDTVAPMMAAPRTADKANAIFPNPWV